MPFAQFHTPNNEPSLHGARMKISARRRWLAWRNLDKNCRIKSYDHLAYHRVFTHSPRTSFGAVLRLLEAPAKIAFPVAPPFRHGRTHDDAATRFGIGTLS
jgi:hypothetical protein